MAKIIKRIEIVVEMDEDSDEMMRTLETSPNMNTYELIGILAALHVEAIQGLNSPAPGSEGKNEPE